MKFKNIIIYILVSLIIVAGIIIWKINGFNLELQFAKRQQIVLSNKTGINKIDVEQIASEVLGNNKYFVQEVETFRNSVSIVSEEITEKQKEQIIEKFNEKHKTDIKSKDTKITEIPFTRVVDMIKPFVIPVIVIITIILLYFLIRFKSLGWKVVLIKTVIIPVLAELLLYSIIAITGIPFGRIAIAISIGLYVIIIAILANKFENQRENKLSQKQETERK